MRTTLNLNDDILKEAAALTGIKEKTTLILKGLKALIGHEKAKRLADLGATEKSLRSILRRKIKNGHR